MGERSRQPLPWGQGIDRLSGTQVVDPSVFNDIRNVHLRHGRTAMRKGLLRQLLIPAPWTDLLGVYLIRAQGLAAAIVWDAATARVAVFAIDASLGTAFVDVLWTLPAGSAIPLITAAEQYGQLVIAHDEAVYPQRQVTMVYSAVEATVGPLMLDLGRTGVPEAAKFRGVAHHLAYMVGWGYGTNQPDQGDRAEVLRISLPGEPTNFVPEHYELVGTQGDPIIGVGACGRGLAVQKVGASYVLVGSGRSNFGMDKLDPKYGLVGARLGVAVNDEWLFWSLSGPRSTTGGASSDLGQALNLAFDAPDPLATATAQERGFAYYDEAESEVVFVFGQWAYVLHLKDGDRRWSYRQFAVPLVNAGLLYTGGTLGTVAIAAHPEIVNVVYTEPTYAPGDGDPKLTVNYNVVGGAVTTEMCEVWVQSQVAGSPWRRKANIAAGAGSTTFKVDGFWTNYKIGIRFVSGGFAGAGYTSADPNNWPAVSRATQNSGGEVAAWTLGKWKRYSGTSQGYDAQTFVGPMQNQTTVTAPLSYRIERDFSDGAGFQLLVTGVAVANVPAAIRFLNSDSLKPTSLRIRPEGPHGAGAWAFPTSPAITIGPEGPATVTAGGYLIRTPNNNDDGHHDGAWTAPANVGTDTPADGPYEYKYRHTSNPSPPGAFGSLVSAGVGVHNHSGSTYVVPLVDPSSGGVRTAEFYVRVNLGGGDVSPFKLGTFFEP